MLAAAVALVALAGCAEQGVVRNDPGAQAETTCAANGFGAESPEHGDCVEALRRGRIFVGPNVSRTTLNSIYYQACLANNLPPVGCACLMNQLEHNGLSDRALRSLLINAGVIWQPPVSQFFDVTPVTITTQQCRLRFP